MNKIKNFFKPSGLLSADNITRFFRNEGRYYIKESGYERGTAWAASVNTLV